MTPFEIGIIFGAMAGWAGFFYLIYKSKMDKPKLKFQQESRNFYPPTNPNDYFTVISIRMKVHNKGSKRTTIYQSVFTFNYNGKSYSVKDDRTQQVISPNSTVDFFPSLNLSKEKILIHEKIDDCVLTVDHTFGDEVFNLGTIEEYKMKKR